MKSKVFIAVLVLLTAAVPAIGATQAELLAQGIAALHDKSPTQQSVGISILESVIANGPSSPEAGTACYQLGMYYKADREKSLSYFKQSYGIEGKDQPNAGISMAHTLVAMGKKLDAAAVFEEVGTRFPKKASNAFYRGGMCYLGESRGKIQSLALRNKAKEGFATSAALGNLEAKLQLLGMRWEDRGPKDKWENLIPDLEAYAEAAKAPAYARARCLLMIAEHSQRINESDRVLEYTDRVLVPEYKKCRAEQAWAMRVKARTLEFLGRWSEAAALYSDIYSTFTDADNFGGNNVRATALYRKAEALNKLGLKEESSAVMEVLRQEYPDIYADSPPELKAIDLEQGVTE